MTKNRDISDILDKATTFTANVSIAGLSPIGQPQGRLTLTTLTPVLASNASAQSTVYYTPYTGLYVPIYDGTTMIMTSIGSERSQATTDATKSPAAATTSSNYDMFVWSDSGTIRCTRGPLWSSATTRGTGAGTTELQMIQGILTNKVAITNGPAANRGTYVGTVRTNATSTVDWIMGGVAAGGAAGILNVWNTYNRRLITAFVKDSTDTYLAVATSGYDHMGSANNRITFINGLQEDWYEARFDGSLWATATALAQPYVDVDGGGITGTGGYTVSTNTSIVFNFSVGAMSSGLGSHYFQAKDSAITANVTYYGDGAQTFVQSGLFFRGMM